MLSPVSLQTNIAAFLAPCPRLCVSQHGTFCLTPGGNTGANYPAWSPPTPGSQTSGDAVCSRPLSPPALACLSSLSTHHQHHHQHGPVSGTSGLCHKHQCAWDTGTGCHLEQRQRQWLPGAGNVSCELTLVAIRAIERRGRGHGVRTRMRRRLTTQ